MKPFETVPPLRTWRHQFTSISRSETFVIEAMLKFMTILILCALLTQSAACAGNAPLTVENAREVVLGFIAGSRKMLPVIRGKVSRQRWELESNNGEWVALPPEESVFTHEMLPGGKFKVRESPRYNIWHGGVTRFLQYDREVAYDGYRLMELTRKQGAAGRELSDINELTIEAGTSVSDRLDNTPWLLPLKEVVLGSARLQGYLNCDLLRLFKHTDDYLQKATFTVDAKRQEIVCELPSAGDSQNAFTSDVFRLAVRDGALMSRELRWNKDFDGHFVVNTRVTSEKHISIQGVMVPTIMKIERFHQGKAQQIETLQFKDLQSVPNSKDAFEMSLPSGTVVHDKRLGITFRTWRPEADLPTSAAVNATK